MEIIKKVEDRYLKKNLRSSSIVTNEFKLVFGAIALSIGIREPLELRDFDNIFTFLKRNYGGLNLQEIAEAFDYYSAQRLDFKDSHFNSFDQVFVGKVLKSYQNQKQKERLKPKLIGGQEQRIESTFNEKKLHFEWLLNNVYLDESKRNGRKGEFPEVTICNWKDCYDYMISEEMIKEKKGILLTKQLEKVKNLVTLEDTNPRKSFSSAVIGRINSGSKPMSYYRFEVMTWFRENKEQLTF